MNVLSQACERSAAGSETNLPDHPGFRTSARLPHAAGQIFGIHGDSDGGQFNFSEIAGNSTAVTI